MNSTKGSFTVEAAIIIPIACFLIITLLYIIILLHDKTCLQTIANHAAKKSTLDCLNQVSISNNYPISYQTKKEEGLYWRLMGKYAQRDHAIKAFIYQEIEEKLIMNDLSHVSISYAIDNGLAGDHLTIRIKKDVKISLQPINRLMKSPNFPLKLSVQSSAYMTEPTEIIRNINLIDETIDKINLDKIEHLWKEQSDDLRNILYKK